MGDEANNAKKKTCEEEPGLEMMDVDYAENTKERNILETKKTERNEEKVLDDTRKTSFKEKKKELNLPTLEANPESWENWRKIIYNKSTFYEKGGFEQSNVESDIYTMISDSEFYRGLVEEETAIKVKKNILNMKNVPGFFWNTFPKRDQNVLDRSLDFRYFKKTEDDNWSDEADLNNVNTLIYLQPPFPDDCIDGNSSLNSVNQSSTPPASLSSAENKDFLQSTNSSNPISKPEELNLKDLRILLNADILDSSNFKAGITTVRIKASGYEGINLSYSDLSCLDHQRYLTDNVIDIYLIYILSTLPSDLSKRIFLFPCTFYLKCVRTNFDESKERKGISKWSRGVNIFSKDFIIIPVCHEHHWILIIIRYVGNIYSESESLGEKNLRNLKSPCIFILDSINGVSFNQFIISVIRKYLQSLLHEAKNTSLEFLENSLPVKRLATPFQENAVDCGLFILQFMKSFFSSHLIYDSCSPEITFDHYVSRKNIKKDIVELLIKSCK